MAQRKAKRQQSKRRRIMKKHVVVPRQPDLSRYFPGLKKS
jgi:hypothetical protein